MEYSFLFPLMQKPWKSIKKCKTYSRKATGLFFSRTRCIIHFLCENFLRQRCSRPIHLSIRLQKGALYWDGADQSLFRPCQCSWVRMERKFLHCSTSYWRLTPSTIASCWSALNAHLVLHWFESYITNRSQSVRFGDNESSSTGVDCRVSQGSVLGPLLFVLYTADRTV